MINAANVVYRKPEDIIEVGMNIQRIREERGLSQDDLGHMTDIKSTSISRYERGCTEMGITVLIQILDALDAKPEDVLPERLRSPKKLSTKKQQFIQLVESLSESDLDLMMPLTERLLTEK